MSEGARERVRPLLRLVRLPNTLTALADVLAGAAIAGRDPLQGDVLLAGLGSAALYGGGVALNDVQDLEKDRRLHPGRDLAAGRIGRGAALAVALSLLALGAASAAAGGPAHVAVTFALVLAIVLYDALPERRKGAAALLMGTCRGLNVLRGVTLGDAAAGAAWAAPLGHLVLILLVTRVSQREDAPVEGTALRRLAASFLLPYLVPAALALAAARPAAATAAAAAGIALAIHVASPCFGRRPAPGLSVMRAVFTLVVFDALYPLASGRPFAALLLVLLLPLIRQVAGLIGQRGS